MGEPVMPEPVIDCYWCTNPGKTPIAPKSERRAWRGYWAHLRSHVTKPAVVKPARQKVLRNDRFWMRAAKRHAMQSKNEADRARWWRMYYAIAARIK